MDEARRMASLLDCHDASPYWFLITPTGAGNLIRISQIRDLQAKLISKAPVGCVKVAVFLDAHRMREESQNALLKTLEEPPEDTLLLLLTSQPQELLPTVRSRCRLVDIHDLVSIPDRADLELVEEILQDLRTNGYMAVFDKAAFVQGSRKGKVKEFLDALEHHLRNAMVDSLTPPVFREHGAAMSERMLEALTQVWKTGYLMERNVNTLLLLENLLIKLKKLDIRAVEGGSSFD